MSFLPSYSIFSRFLLRLLSHFPSLTVFLLLRIFLIIFIFISLERFVRLFLFLSLLVSGDLSLPLFSVHLLAQLLPAIYLTFLSCLLPPSLSLSSPYCFLIVPCITATRPCSSTSVFFLVLICRLLLHIQGLNALAGFILLVLENEEDAFWTMVAVVEEIMCFEYYRFPLVGSHIDQCIFLGERRLRRNQAGTRLRRNQGVVTNQGSTHSRLLMRFWIYARFTPKSKGNAFTPKPRGETNQGSSSMVAKCMEHSPVADAFFGYTLDLTRLVLWLLDLVEMELPSLAAHFKGVDFNLKTTSFKWFFTAYVGSLPSRVVLRIWDAYLAEGRTVSTVKFSAPRLLSCLPSSVIRRIWTDVGSCICCCSGLAYVAAPYKLAPLLCVETFVLRCKTRSSVLHRLLLLNPFVRIDFKSILFLRISTIFKVLFRYGLAILTEHADDILLVS